MAPGAEGRAREDQEDPGGGGDHGAGGDRGCRRITRIPDMDNKPFAKKLSRAVLELKVGSCSFRDPNLHMISLS